MTAGRPSTIEVGLPSAQILCFGLGLGHLDPVAATDTVASVDHTMAYAIIVPGSFRVGVPKSGPLTRENLTRSFQPTGGTQPEWHLCDTSLCRSGWRLARAASDAAPDSPAGRGGRPDSGATSYGTRPGPLNRGRASRVRLCTMARALAPQLTRVTSDEFARAAESKFKLPVHLGIALGSGRVAGL